MATTLANMIAGAATSVSIGGSDVGGTLGPVTLRKEEDDIKIGADQHQGRLGRKVADVRYFIVAHLAEPTLENVRIALNQASSNLSAGTLTVDEDENGSVAVVIVGPANKTGSTARTITASICEVVSVGEITYEKTSQQVVRIEFEVYQDPSNGKWYQAVDA